MYTYFVQGVRGGSIKIGKTRQDPKERLKNLQTGSPEELQIVGLLKGDIETELHNKFKNLRKHGEWFDNKPELVSYIESLPTDTLNKVLQSDVKYDGAVPNTVAPKVYRVLMGRGSEKIAIDFDFVYTNDQKYDYGNGAIVNDTDFFHLEDEVCYKIGGITEIMGMTPRLEWSYLDQEDQKFYKEEWENSKYAWGDSDEECYDNYTKEYYPSSEDIMSEIMYYVHSIENSTEHFGRKVNFFNKVCISTDRGCTFFFCNAVSSATRRGYINDLADLCWKMDEFCAHSFIAYDEHNDECLDLNQIARNRIFQLDEEVRFKPEDIRKISY
ncbi:MAG: GIY-YIG nuclease family protein [Candidatus Bathyarchaeota archaeon]|nr:GIY-YIG nuclease family protein [Candidatus Bathyarchaeota archaeon]